MPQFFSGYWFQLLELISSTANKSVTLYNNLGINVLVQSVAVFVFIKEKFKKKENEHKTKRIIKRKN